MFASGAPAALVRTLPWMEGPHAAAVRASLAAHDPTGRLEAEDLEELRRTAPTSATKANPWLT